MNNFTSFIKKGSMSPYIFIPIQVQIPLHLHCYSLLNIFEIGTKSTDKNTTRVHHWNIYII